MIAKLWTPSSADRPLQMLSLDGPKISIADGRFVKSVQPFAIEVRIDPGQADRADFVHRFRNYGEDLWALLRFEGRVSIDLEAVDASLDHFRFSAANAIIAKRAVAAARELMAKHHLSGSVKIIVP